MIAIQGGKVVTITGGIIENGTILVDGKKIVAVGQNIDIPSDAKIINATGKVITPGFIDAHTHLSTFSEPVTMPVSMIDGNETSSPITPTVRAQDALNPFDTAIPKVRAAGFTTCCTLPGSANIIGGTGIVFKLRGNTAEKMIIPGTEQMKMALGENPKRVYGHGKNGQMPVTRMGTAGLWRETLFNAKVYSDALKAAETDPSKAPKPDFKMEALVPVIRGEMKCRIHAHRSDDIMTAIRVAEEFNLDYSIEHCTEGYRVADEVAKRNLFCVIGPLLMSPSKQELWDVRLTTPAVMAEAGANVCLTADTGSGTVYLPIHAGLCIARGLSEQAAYESLTIKPATLLGIADRVGSIEPGKDADLVIFDGNPFSNLTLTEMVLIDGEIFEGTKA